MQIASWRSLAVMTLLATGLVGCPGAQTPSANSAGYVRDRSGKIPGEGVGEHPLKPDDSSAAASASPVSLSAGPTTAPVNAGDDSIIATLDSVKITRNELDAPLYEAFGLRMLFDVAELKVAEATLTSLNLKLEQADIDAERDLLLKKLNGPDTSPVDYERGLQQFLDREHMSAAEFQIKAVETNACLRKVVKARSKQQLTDEDVHKAFDQIYGQKRQIADIQCATMAAAARAKKMLETEPFGQVARQVSTDTATSGMGGVWEQGFSMASPESVVPKAIREAAFTLQVNQVYPDIIQAGTDFYIIKLVNEINQQIVKYDDVKDSVRAQLEDQITDFKIKALRKEVTVVAQKSIQIEQPTLARQWQEMIDQNAPKSADRNQVRKELDRESPSTKPSAGGAGK